MSPEHDLFLTTLRGALRDWSLPITQLQADQLYAHYDAMVEANRTTNLTRITDPVESAIKHYADSLALLKWVEDRGVILKTLLDVGTGAGFPAVPLAVMRPEWSITAIDATRKKIEFVRRTAAAIGLTNLQCEHAHSKHWKPGRFFDLVTFRALRKLSTSLAETAGFMSMVGWLVAFRAEPLSADERPALRPLLSRVRMTFEEEYPYALQLRGQTLSRVLQAYRRRHA
jgi:16S rRNA (guanine527-N7)-methyltransferase